MKSLAELEAIRAKTLEHIAMRKEVHDAALRGGRHGDRGIAAGAAGDARLCGRAEPSAKLDHVTVSQTGCVGMCAWSPWWTCWCLARTR